MARIIFINRIFHPDQSENSQLLTDLAFHLSVRGRHVNVITARYRDDDPMVVLPPYELIKGVRVDRVWTPKLGRNTALGRKLRNFFFRINAARLLSGISQRGDVVVTLPDPVRATVTAGFLGRLSRARVVNWLQGIEPELENTRRGRNGGNRLRRKRNAALGKAALNLVPGEGMAAYLVGEGMDPGRIRVLPHWCRAESVQPLPAAENPLRREWGMEGRFVLGHRGRLDRLDDFSTLLDAAATLRNRGSFTPLFVGVGRARDKLMAELRGRGLANAQFRPYQPRDRLAVSLSVPDAYLVVQRPGSDGLMMPGGFYDALAAGRPVVYLGATEGEIPGLLAEHRCGVAVATGDTEGFVAAVAGLMTDPDARREMGVRARALHEARFERTAALAAWSEALDGVMG